MFKYKIKFLPFIKTISILVFILNISNSFAKDLFIDQLKVTGEKRLSESFILKYVPKLKNGIITDEILNTITKNLYMSGYFSDIKIKIEQSSLEIIVEEFPIINEIIFVGNDILSEDQLIPIINIKSRDIFNKQVINDAIENIQTEYQRIGRYLAEINLKKTNLSEGRVNLIFEILEGPALYVRNVNFTGNNFFSDSDLKSVITTKEDAWYKIFGSNKFVPSRLEYDKEKLYSFYKERGYINFNIKIARGDLLPDFSGFNINFVVEEGLRFKINDINIKSNLNDKPNKNLINELFIKKGEYFDNRDLDESSIFLNNYYSTLGYSFVKVIPLLSQKNDLVDIVFKIKEGNKNYINKISIVGNTRTIDSVIRRELLFLEGDSFNRTKLISSIKAIRRLGFFSSVDYRIDKTDKSDSVDVIIQVEETNTGSLTFGVGYSSLNNTSISFGLTENNFLGEGKKARFDVNLSDQKSTYNIGFTEPYYLSKPIALSADLFKQEFENSKGDIKLDKFGFGLGIGVKQKLNSHKFKYIFSENKSTTSKTSTAQSITGEEGLKIITSGISYTVSNDTRDNYINPSSGYNWLIQNTLAGIGGDAKYLKSSASYKIYYPFNYGEYVIGLKTGLGFVSALDDKVTRSNRFLLGSRKIRGFDSSGIGPRDLGNKGAVGGNNFYNATVEMKTDKFMPDDTGIEWLLFSDIGSLWGTDYEAGVQGFKDYNPRITTGFGLLMNSPVGPLQVIWGYPLQSEKYDVEENFQFSIGTNF